MDRAGLRAKLSHVHSGGQAKPEGRPLTPLTLIDDQRQVLEPWVRRRKTAQALALQAQLGLLGAKGVPNQDAAARHPLTPKTVSGRRGRFVERRLDGLLDEPGPGAPRTISDAAVGQVITLTPEVTPENAAHWSTRLMAARTGMSQSAISRIRRTFGLQPRRSETFKLSSDPLLIEKVRDIVGLCLNPPDKALLLSPDEKSQIQALDRTQPMLAMRLGRIERRNHGLVRHGTTSLSAALIFKTGQVLAQCHRRHRSVEFRRFNDHIHANVPEELDVRLIVDNYVTQEPALTQRRLVRHPRFHLHFTPTGSTWLILVERFFAALTKRRLRRGVHRSARELENPIYHDIHHQDRDPRLFIWTKTAERILDSLARLCRRVSG